MTSTVLPSVGIVTPVYNGERPLVSFVVPCYKLAHFLPECITSILAQTYRDFEVLIMDNCSPDQTPEVARSFHDPRVKHIRNDVNIGHLRNFNKGIMLTRGKYVWLVSADDFLTSPHALARYVDMMERNPELGYVFCRAYEAQGARQVGTVFEFTDCGKEDRIWKAPTFLKELIRLNCVVMSSVMARRECYDKITLFPLDMPHAADWYLWCTFALHYDVAYVSEPMVCWRIHEGSVTNLLKRGEVPVCLIDEINVLGRVIRLAELAGVPSLRGDCNASIVRCAVRALSSRLAGNSRLDLSEFETTLRRNVRDPKDEEGILAHVYVALGDERYWNGDRIQAMRLYWVGLRLRPWWLKSWAKYLLLRMGGPGISVRRLVSRTAAAARPKG